MFASTSWSDHDHNPSGGTTMMESDHEVVELPILLPEWQVSALEEAARDRGMTIGQLLRRLVSDIFPRSMMAQRNLA